MSRDGFPDESRAVMGSGLSIQLSGTERTATVSSPHLLGPDTARAMVHQMDKYHGDDILASAIDAGHSLFER